SASVDRIVDLIRPKRLVFLSIDGVPPRIKEWLQRERRARTAEAQAGSGEFLSFAITPGTRWMRQVEAHLDEHIERKHKMDDKWRQVKVVLSGCRDPGEGEQKIMRYLESTRDTRFQHCVWSNDADTVLLSLAAHVPNITMVSERTPNGVPTYTVVDIDELESQLVKRYAPTQEITGNIVRRQKFIDDLVFMSFLAGNDFLPPAVNMQTTDSDALDRLWRLYAGSPLVDMNIHDRGVINVDAFRILLDLLEVEYEQRDFRKHIGVMSLGSQLTALRIRRLAWDSQRHQLSNSESATATETEVLLEEVMEKRPRKKKRGKESKSERRARKTAKQKQDLPFVWTGGISDISASDTELE
ncbi:5'-3' exoribonuclease 1, partial [Linderina pennispora]